MKKILITGGSGFVGTHLIHYLLNQSYLITAIDLASSHPAINHPSFRYICADLTKTGEWQAEVAKADVIINLAGTNIFKIWNKKYKEKIYNSRILTTQHIVQALPNNRQIHLISTSAIGYYGDRRTEQLKENESYGNDFLATVCRDWEKAANVAEMLSHHVTLTRFGVVLSHQGGAMPMMLLSTLLFGGWKLGYGEQWFSWIHIEDLIRAIHFIIDQKKLIGPVNLCAPHPIQNKDLTETLAKALNRPAIFAMPARIVKLALGEFGQALLSSQRAIPYRLDQAGFIFNHPYFVNAASDIVSLYRKQKNKKT
ncbi:MAG: TIGR01777 family protein [Desulfobacterales bacterium]|nr:TIGR01777 family protein [Desulfobacterales bacterium]